MIVFLLELVRKPWLRNAIIGQAIETKADIKHFSKLRDNARTKSANLKANNPAYSALKEHNKDKDLDGTIENMVNSRVIDYINNEVESYKDETVKEVVKNKAQQYKEELKLKDKELGDNAATGDFTAIQDIIDAEVEAKLYDTFVHGENSLYEEVVNTNKSIPKIENKLKIETELMYEVQYSTFRNKIDEATKVDSKDTVESINSKIKIIDDTTTELKRTGEDPYAEKDKPTKKLHKRIDAYLNTLETRRKYLNQKKVQISSVEAVIADRETKNKELEGKLASKLKEFGFDKIKAKFTGKRHAGVNQLINKKFRNLVNVITESEEAFPFGESDIKGLEQTFNIVSTNGILEEFINELLVVSGYITDFELTPTDTSTHKQNADEFREATKVKETSVTSIGEMTVASLNERAQKYGIYNKDRSDIASFILDAFESPNYKDILSKIPIQKREQLRLDAFGLHSPQMQGKARRLADQTKNVIDFTSQNPINKSLVDLANKWITGIINDGNSPIFLETNPDGTAKTIGTKFSFAPIAAKYGELVGADNLRRDFELLKLAYTVIRNSKINPETGTKRIYNTDKTLSKITVQHIIDTYNITSDFKDYDFYSTTILDRTGGKDVTNIYLPAELFSTESDENGNQVVNSSDIERISTILTSLEVGDKVVLSHNTLLSEEKGFSQNKNNPDTIPIKVEVIKGDKHILIGAINTPSTDHLGVKYSFKGKDWTDILLQDSNSSNAKIDFLNRLFPALQNFYNVVKMRGTAKEQDEALEELIDADISGLLTEITGISDLATPVGKTAITHISRVLFFGQNTDGNTPSKFDRVKVLDNVGRWKDKLYRDQIGIRKIRQILGTDTTKTIESEVGYITSGALVMSRNKEGEVVYQNLSVIDDPSKVQLYTIKTNTQSKVLKNSKSSKDVITKVSGSFTHSLYIGIEGKNVTESGGKIIPMPIIQNNLSGSFLKSNNGKEILDKTIEIIQQIGAARVNRRNANTEGRTGDGDDFGRIIDNLVEKLRDVVNIDYTDQGHANAIVSNNHDIRFKSNDITYVYNYYETDVKKQFHTIRTTGLNQTTETPSTLEEFKTELGKLNRNINYEKLGGKRYTDILDNVHNSYEEYLINTNSIVTDVGKLVTKDGTKISNFTLRSSNPAGGLNLIVNIKTDHLKTEIPIESGFSKFTKDFKLDPRYDFVFGTFDSLTRNGEVKFNGVVSESKTQGGRDILVWYDPNTKSISVSKKWTEIYKKNPVNASLVLVHDIIHALNGSRSKEEQVTLIKELTSFRDGVINTEEYKALVVKSDKTEIEKKIITIFDMKDVEEILTYGLTDTNVARFLDSIKTTEHGVTLSFWSKLKEIIRRLAESFGIGTKLDELNYIFDRFMNGEKLEQDNVSKIVGKVEGNIEDDFNEIGYSDLDINAVSFTSDYKVYNKQEVIEELIVHWHEEGREILREELPKLSKEEFEEEAKKAGYYSLGKYWTVHTVANLKAASFSSILNQQITGSPFSIEEEKNIFNVMSNHFIQVVAAKYKGQKLGNIPINTIRTEVALAINTSRKRRVEDGTWDNSKDDLLIRVLRAIKTNDNFWKAFRIYLSNQYGYNINEIEDFVEDVELLEKSWDQKDVFTKNSISTISDQIKDLINTTPEVDPNSIELTEDGKVLWTNNTSTPTGFANTLSVNKHANKIRDLMRGSLTKEDMLNALLEYAQNQDTILAKSFYSIHSKLKDDPSLLNTWFTSFEKAIIDSYRDLRRTINNEGGTETELNITSGNRSSVEYHLANLWTNTIVSRGENKFFTKEWIDKWEKLYKDTILISPNFRKMNDEVADNIVTLYKMIGVELNRNSIFYEFNKHKEDFYPNFISPMLYIKGEPNKVYKSEDKIPYIDKLQTFPDTSFDQFGRLYELANKVKYFEEKYFNFSTTNTKHNLVSEVGNPSFISNFFKKLRSSEDVVYDALIDYTKVPSNQYSLLLWGNQIEDTELVKEGRGIFDYSIINGIKVPISDKFKAINKRNLNHLKNFRYEGDRDLNTGKANEYSDLTKNDWTLKSLIYYFGLGETTKGKEVNEKLSAIFPLINPSDRKNTALFEAPIIEITASDLVKLLKAQESNDLDSIRNIPIFKAIYNSIIEEMIAMNTAKKIIFVTDENGRIRTNADGSFELKSEINSEELPTQLYYHYKLVDGKKEYIVFDKDENGVYTIDSKNSGNVFSFNNITVDHLGEQIGFNEVHIKGQNFVSYLT